MKPIRLSAHAKGYIEKRGFTLAEVETAIRESAWEDTGKNRKECRQDFTYSGEWNGKSYGTKQVRPIFVEEEHEIVVITVYTYYF